MKLGNVDISFERPLVMAIINVTPDSFFAGSRNGTGEEILARVETAVEQGASILDVGGYSSRPGAGEVSPGDELERVGRAMEIIRAHYPQIPVSVDTFRASVARGVVEKYGPVIVNDISAGELDPSIVGVAAEHELPYIAMHMRGNPSNMQQHTSYGNIVDDVRGYFEKKIDRLREQGLRKIIIDPGFGFAKTTWQNYELLEGMDSLLDFGLPILAGISRKSMICQVLETTPDQALTGTIALNWECLRQGAAILRVHDVREAAQVVRLFDYYKG